MASSSAITAGHGEAVEMVSRSNMKDGTFEKNEHQTAISETSLENQDSLREATKSTHDDLQNMRRMGKEQQLVRNFRVMSLAALTALCTAAWEIGMFLLSPALINGGRAGCVWSCLWSFILFAPIYLSMAEMASMSPICGAQYHWVSEFAPENCQRILSYVTGWTSTVAWQSGNALGIFLVASVAQTMITVANEDYTAPAWHCTLLALGACAIAFAGNVYGARILPHWQNAVFAVHILAFFAVVIPPWISAERASHSQVWLDFESTGGWSSLSLSILVGSLTGISNQVGIDTAAHMSEEVKDAASAVPRAMMAVYLINMCLIFPVVLTICYHIPDLQASLADTTTYPAIYVLRQSMSTTWLLVLLFVIILLNTASNISYLAAVTRDAFAFARDKGLPFSPWLSTVHPRRRVPVNATICSTVVAALLSLIYIGSPLAFYAITSLLTIALLQCYSFSIGCVLWRRIYHPETLPHAKFSLGKFGIPCNILAVVYSVWCFFWSAWPQEYPVTASNFNWASPLFLITLVVAFVYFVFRGRKVYTGPVAEVEGRKVHIRHTY